MTATVSIHDKDRHALVHPFTALSTVAADGPTRVFTEASGCTLTDVDGRRYLDALAGLWCVNIGYGNEEMAEALARQTRTLSYYHTFAGMTVDTAAELADRIVGLAPGSLSRVFFGLSGSDANDTNAKIVWYYNNALGRPEKKKLISRHRGYHGVTVLSAGLTGLTNLHDAFDLPLPMIRHVRPPHRLWEAEPGMSDAEFVQVLCDELEELILAEGPDTVAAFIAEPVQAAGGVVFPPEGYFPAIAEVLRRYDVLLIADEVVTGFGRLGAMFGSDVLGIEPDLMTIAKGVTSAYAPLSGSLVSERVWDVIADESLKHGVFGHGYTYSAHPLSAAAAMTNLDIIERDGLVARAGSQGEVLQRLVRESFTGHPLVVDIRGRGLIAAVEFGRTGDRPTPFDPADKVGARITRRSLELGVITRALPAADTIAFSPPFVVTDDELETMVRTTRKAADEIARELGLG